VKKGGISWVGRDVAAPRPDRGLEYPELLKQGLKGALIDALVSCIYSDANEQVSLIRIVDMGGPSELESVLLRKTRL